MGLGCGFLGQSDNQASVGLDGPITDEPQTWSFDSVPYLNIPQTSSPRNVQNLESSDGFGSSSSSDSPSDLASSWGESSYIASQGVLGGGVARHASMGPFPESPAARDSAPVSQIGPVLPTLSLTGPSHSRLFISKQGPIANIVRSATLPESPGSPITGVVDLTLQIKTLSPQAFAHGGFADIHWGEWGRPLENGQIEKILVVIKLLRTLTSQDVDGVRARKRLNREVYVWHRLDHPNIAKMFGTSYHMAQRPALVLEWYQNGSASEYLKKNPLADRKMLVHDIARGLKYLHCTLKPPIVHGDLKGNNVLITRAGHAVLSDFGLSQVIEDLTEPSGNTTTTLPGTVRWQAPELILDDDNNQKQRLTFSSDVWSFGCTAYELLTGNIPYHKRQRDFSVIQDIMHGVKPGSPDASLKHAPGPQDKIWHLIYRCWSFRPDQRPQMREVVTELNNM